MENFVEALLNNQAEKLVTVRNIECPLDQEGFELKKGSAAPQGVPTLGTRGTGNEESTIENIGGDSRLPGVPDGQDVLEVHNQPIVRPLTASSASSFFFAPMFFRQRQAELPEGLLQTVPVQA